MPVLKWWVVSLSPAIIFDMVRTATVKDIKHVMQPIQDVYGLDRCSCHHDLGCMGQR